MWCGVHNCVAIFTSPHALHSTPSTPRLAHYNMPSGCATKTLPGTGKVQQVSGGTRSNGFRESLWVMSKVFSRIGSYYRVGGEEGQGSVISWRRQILLCEMRNSNIYIHEYIIYMLHSLVHNEVTHHHKHTLTTKDTTQSRRSWFYFNWRCMLWANCKHQRVILLRLKIWFRWPKCISK